MANCGESARNTCRYLRVNKYAIYVLTILMLVYMMNQLATFCLIATNADMAQEIGYGDRECDSANDSALNNYLEASGLSNVTVDEYCAANSELCDNGFQWENATLCYWRYLGKGLEYQLLAGPLYIVLFSISGIPMGLVSELRNVNRKLILFICIILWSAMTIVGGFCTEYWHLAVTRLLVGIASAGCVPFCASIISDYFEPSARGGALGFYNWGVYLGYSLTFSLTLAADRISWQSVYWIAGSPGVLMAILVITTIKEPRRESSSGNALDELAGTWSKTKAAFAVFADPALLLLCFGGAIRNGAGFVWAYNIVIFFDEYHPGTQTSDWMTWIPLVFGSIGAFGGGFVSDKLAKNRGVVGRLMVLISCLILSAPFNVGTLWAPMPWAFICHIPAYVIGEMWIGVCVAVVIDLVPADLTTSAVAVYFFIIQIIGGNMPLLVPPIEEAIGLQFALLIMFPGMYIAGALFMIASLVIILKQRKTKYDLGDDRSEVKGSEGSAEDDDADDEDDIIKSTEPLHKTWISQAEEVSVFPAKSAFLTNTKL